ncbi:MAG: hypothetical protein AAF609_21005 [Cyanobacteria bacterium P01_C01_bin.120]
MPAHPTGQLIEHNYIQHTGTFSLQAEVASEWAVANQTLAVQVGWSVEGLVTMINAPLTIQGGGPLAIADELSLQDINFALMLEAGDWLLAGDVVAIPFDETLTPTASYMQMSDRPQPLNDGRLWGAPSFKLESLAL